MFEERKTVFKLFKLRKDGSLGSLFINARARLQSGVWLKAKTYPTKGFKIRGGWHTVGKRKAPHLSKKGRVWRKVLIQNFSILERSKYQGEKWYLAKKMKILDKNI